MNRLEFGPSQYAKRRIGAPVHRNRVLTMDPTKIDWPSPQLTAAVIAGVVSLFTGFVSAIVSVKVASQRANVDEKLAALKGDIDRDLVDLKARLDNRTLFQAERLAHELLMHDAWQMRSFDAIQHHIAGFADNDPRQILVRAGALRFTRPSDGKEMWGLLERNRETLKKVGSTK